MEGGGAGFVHWLSVVASEHGQLNKRRRGEEYFHRCEFGFIFSGACEGICEFSFLYVFFSPLLTWTIF